MSILSEQIKELREMADMIGSEGVTGDDLPDIQRALREAADTIESLRDRLQELQGVGGESRYTALFGTPERAARTMAGKCGDCCECVIEDYCEHGCDEGCLLSCACDYDALIEWLRGESDGE